MESFFINRGQDKFQRLDISRMLDEISRTLKFDFVQWMDTFNRRNADKIDWWLYSISSRNIYTSNLFQYFCYFEMVKKMYSDAENNRAQLIIVESSALSIDLCRWLNKNQIKTRILNTVKTYMGFYGNYIHFIFQWLSSVLSVISRLTAALMTRKKKALPSNARHQILLDTFVLSNSISSEGIFVDRFYPNLYEFLYKNSFDIIVHPVIAGLKYNYFSIYKRMRLSDTPLVIREDFLSPGDFISAIYFPCKLLVRKIRFEEFRNLEIDHIVFEDKLGRSLAISVDAFLIYRLILRLKKHIDPEYIICWFENQVIDRAFIAGIRTAFPDKMIIGSQLFIHSPNYLSQFPIESEVEARLIPDVLLEMSDFQCKRIKTFTDKICCKSVASLRHSYIFTIDQSCMHKDEEKKVILVLLPQNLMESVEILDALSEVTSFVEKSSKIMIKHHPTCAPEQLKHACGKKTWNDKFEICSDTMLNALLKSDIIISSNSSSMVEAAVMGKPVIFLGQQTALNHNMLDDVEHGIVSRCFTSEELLQAVQRNLNLSESEKEEFKRIGEQLCERYFTPINDETLAPFLPHEYLLCKDKGDE